MNIVLFSPSWPLQEDANGITTYCSNIAPAMEQQGHTVIIVTGQAMTTSSTVFQLSYRPSRLTKLYLSFVNYFHKGYRQYYLGSRAIVHELGQVKKKYHIDVFEIEESFGWHFYIQKKCRFPVIMRLHGPHYINGVMDNQPSTTVDFNRFKREQRAFSAARYVTAPCKWIKREVEKKYNLNWQLSKTIYNPINRIPKNLRWSFDSHKKLQILFVGRFDRHKGGDIVLKAFALILKKSPHANLIFAGPDRGISIKGRKVYIEEYIDSIFSQEDRGKINYLGLANQKTISKLRRESHLCIVASMLENFPYTALESLAHGTPTVASRVGGISELFEDGVSGQYFTGGDSLDLAKKVCSLLNDTNLLGIISKNGLTRSVEKFSTDKIAIETLDFYSQAIADHYDH